MKERVSVHSLNQEEFHFLAVEKRHRLVVHKNDTPLEGGEPEARVSIGLVLPDDDGVRDRKQAHLEGGEGERERCRQR